MLNVKVIIYLLCEKNSNCLSGVVMWRKVAAMGVLSCSKTDLWKWERHVVSMGVLSMCTWV